VDAVIVGMMTLGDWNIVKVRACKK